MGIFLEMAVFYWRDTIALKVPPFCRFGKTHWKQTIFTTVTYNIDVKALMVILSNKYNEFPWNYPSSRLHYDVTRMYLPVSNPLYVVSIIYDETVTPKMC